MAKKFIFTDKKQSYSGLMSTSLGLISIVALILAIRSTIMLGGVSKASFGAGLFMILLFASIGLILGLFSINEDDSFHALGFLGIVLNIINLLGISAILYAGAYGG